MTELLPCPFCGGEAELHPSYDLSTNEIDGYFAWCNNKECECAPETREYFTEAEAIAAWNTRATNDTLTAEQVREAIFHGSVYASYDGVRYYADGIRMQAIADELNSRAERTCSNVDDEFPFFKCSECGCNAVVGYGSSGDGLPNYCPNCGAKVVSE